jgi:ATP phosphoribosyltransferase regulatory subunit
MAKLRKKVNKKQLVWISIAVLAAMALILLAVFLFMDSKEPENLSYHPRPTEPPLQSYYTPEDFVLDVSHMGILSDVLDLLGLSDTGRAALLSCIGEKNLHGAREICRREAVPEEKQALAELLITTYGEPSRVLPLLREKLPADVCAASLDQLEQVLAALPGEIPSGSVRIDFSVIHDMQYYNGLVFKGFVKGIPTGILSGGQYDRLMQRMGKNAGAIGFAVYLDLLEELVTPRAEYDADVILLYTEQEAPAQVAAAVRKLSADGKSVRAQRTLEAGQTCRELWRLQGEEAECLEANA